MFGMGMSEILLILAIALIVFGPKKLPELGRSLGQAMREFRNATNELRQTLNIDPEDVKTVTRSLEDIRSDIQDPLALKPKKKETPAPVGAASIPTATAEPAAVPDDDLPSTDLPAELLADFEKQGGTPAIQEKSAS